MIRPSTPYGILDPHDLAQLLDQLTHGETYAFEDLRAAYREIARANGRVPASDTSLGRALAATGATRRRTRGRAKRAYLIDKGVPGVVTEPRRGRSAGPDPDD